MPAPLHRDLSAGPVAGPGAAPAVGRGRRPANRPIADDDLLRALRDACVAAGGILSQTQLERRGRAAAPGGPGYRPYRRRWGRWANVLAALRVWVAGHDPGFAYRDRLPGADRVPDPPLVRPPPGGEYGTPIAVPGMLHAPVDVTGVLLLFGLMARELGFVIAHVEGAAGGRPAARAAPSWPVPSCEARRRHGDVWERLRLAFVFDSRELRGRELRGREPPGRDPAGHDPGAAGIDLLVCWAHGWAECPLAVLDLRREVAKRA